MAKRKNFGSIRQRGDKWEARYCIDGEYSSFTRDTKKACKEELSRIERLYDMGALKRAPSMSLSGYLDHWLETYGKPFLKHSTYVSYKGYFNNHIKPHPIGRKKLNELSVMSLQQFFNGKAEDGRLDGCDGGLSPKTLINMRNALNVALKQAIIEGLMEMNPVSGLKMPRRRDVERRVLTVSEQITIEDAVWNSQDISVLGVIVTLYTGIRIGELLALTWDNVNIEDVPSSIRIKETLARQSVPDINDPDYSIVSHKEGQTTAVTLGETKTQKSKRVIFLPEAARRAFILLKQWQDTMRLEHGSEYNSGQFVICTLKGGAMEPRTYSDKLDAIVKAMGIPHVNFHALRHTYATRAIEEGMDIATLSENLGHAQISTTLNMYVHVMEEQKKRSAELMDKQKLYEKLPESQKVRFENNRSVRFGVLDYGSTSQTAEPSPIEDFPDDAVGKVINFSIFNKKTRRG